MIVTHEGGCLCGAVRYEVNGEPTWCGACHCKLCQRWTGTAFLIGAYFLDTQVTVKSGVLRQYEFTSDESGHWLRLEFCDQCGTTVTGTAESAPGQRWIAGGTFDDPNWLNVKMHIWTQSAHHSVFFPPDVATYPASQS